MDKLTNNSGKSADQKGASLRLKIVLGIFIIAALYSGITIISQSEMLALQKEETLALRQEYSYFVHELELMQNKAAQVHSDTHVIKTAKEDLGFVMDGEVLFTGETP